MKKPKPSKPPKQAGKPKDLRPLDTLVAKYAGQVAETASFMGIPLKTLNKEELIAVICHTGSEAAMREVELKQAINALSKT